MIADILADTSGRMDRAVEAAKEDFATVRTGRANPQLFQKVMVDYYGSPTPLSQLASLNAPEARTLVVTPYDKSALKAIEQAIRDAADKQTSYEVEYRMLGRDGAVRWVSERGRVHADALGRDLWLDGVIVDISALKHIALSRARSFQQGVSLSAFQGTPLAA